MRSPGVGLSQRNRVAAGTDVDLENGAHDTKDLKTKTVPLSPLQIAAGAAKVILTLTLTLSLALTLTLIPTLILVLTLTLTLGNALGDGWDLRNTPRGS